MSDANRKSQLGAPVVVVGVGNVHRGDDAVGHAVACRLREERLAHVRVLTESGEGTSLMALWQDTNAVILIDAMRSGANPGTVQRIEAGRQPVPRALLRCSTHAFGVADAIELARALGQIPPHVIVYGIEGETFEIGAELSAAVAQAIPQVVSRVCQDIQKLNT